MCHVYTYNTTPCPIFERRNDNLEQQAQALFKSWFVDFEPFRQGKFIESELGLIPEGWKVFPAEKVYNINIGKTPPRQESCWFSSDYQDNVTWVSIADLGSHGMFIDESKEYLTENAVKKFNIPIVPPNTILLSFKLTIGRVAIANTSLTTNEAIARFHLPEEYYREYLYFTLKDYDYSRLGSTSSIAIAVNSKIIKQMRFIFPSESIVKQYHQIVLPLFNEILKNHKEITLLSELRDTLLPKLMSGELKINEINC